MLKVKAEGGGHKLYATVRHVQELVLFCAIENDIETLRSMLAIPGARDVIGVNVKVDHNGMRALHHAAFHGNKPLLELLLELGADPFALDKASHSALYYAMATFKWDCATLLASKMSEIMPHPTLDRHNICPPQPSLPPSRPGPVLRGRAHVSPVPEHHARRDLEWCERGEAPCPDEREA